MPRSRGQQGARLAGPYWTEDHVQRTQTAVSAWCGAGHAAQAHAKSNVTRAQTVHSGQSVQDFRSEHVASHRPFHASTISPKPNSIQSSPERGARPHFGSGNLRPGAPNSGRQAAIWVTQYAAGRPRYGTPGRAVGRANCGLAPPIPPTPHAVWQHTLKRAVQDADGKMY